MVIAFILMEVYQYAPIVGILLSICGLLYYAYCKAQLRTRIRDLHQIPGTLMSDFALHTFMPWCAVAQEAREAIARGRPQLDFMYGQDLSTILFPQVEMEMGGQTPSTPTEMTGMTEMTEMTEMSASTHDGTLAVSSLVDHLKSVSMVSRYLLGYWLAYAAYAFVMLIVGGDGLSVLVLIAVFLQPLLILYFVYWRDPQRTKHVSLDYVIKLFSVGFVMSTAQSVVVGYVLEAVLGLVVSFILYVLNPHMSHEDSHNSNAVAVGAEVRAFLQPVLSKYHWAGMINTAFTNTHTFLSGTHTTQDTTTSYTSADTNTYSPYHPTSYTSESEYYDDDDDVVRHYSPSVTRKYIVVMVFALFVMAFVVAAGVEETMKHFAVRCCKFPAPLRDPKSVLVYLMAAALGVAASQNIEYVFRTSESYIPHTPLVVCQLVVLVTSFCTPLHVICSVMQATSFSKVLMGHANMNLFQILLPAVALHGTFNFANSLVYTIAPVYDVSGATLDVLGSILSIVITLIGAYLAYTGFQSVLHTFESGWQTISEETTGPLHL